MICQRCIYRASALRAPRTLIRSFGRSASILKPAASPASPSPSPEFSTPLTPPKSKAAPAKPKLNIVSSAPAGTVLKGINYIKGHDDPIALPEEEYPEWLWKCLEVEKKADTGNDNEADLLAKSKKVRRAAAKRIRKLEEKARLSGDLSALTPKIPLQQQTIDLPGNEEGTVEGGLEAQDERDKLRKAMRGERRKGIKEGNYLKGMR